MNTTMASEEETDREASSYTLPGEDAEHGISSLKKAVDVLSEEVSDKQPSVELEHEKTPPNKETSVEINTKMSSPDANNEDTENGGELRYISKHLVQFVPNAKPQSKESLLATLHNLAKGIGPLRADNSDSRLLVKCMPMGLTKYTVSFFASDDLHKVYAYNYC